MTDDDEQICDDPICNALIESLMEDVANQTALADRLRVERDELASKIKRLERGRRDG